MNPSASPSSADETTGSRKQSAAQETSGQAAGSGPAFRVAVSSSERKALLILGDMLLTNGVALAALALWARLDGRPFTLDFVRNRWVWFPFLTIAWWGLAQLGDLYDVSTMARFLDVLGRVSVALIGLVIGYLIIFFGSPRNALPRLFFLFFCIGISLGAILWRWIYAALFSLPGLCHRALIVGAGWAGCTLAQALAEQKPSGYDAVGFVDDDLAKRDATLSDLPVLGGSADLVALTAKHGIDEVIVAITHALEPALFQALMDCQARGIHVVRMPAFYEELTRRVPVEHIDQVWVLDALNGSASLSNLAQLAKRALDLLLGALGLVGLGVILPSIALAVALDDRGPLFYTQVRCGRGGKGFRVFKFRTMRVDAERDGRARWAEKNDDRITRVGRFMRKVRLDELPQVINVVRGEMSIVGPRPERPEFIIDLEKEIPFFRTRLVVKPGLTGWAQIHYEYGNSIEDALIKLQYDLYYIRHRTIWLDLYVILRTIRVVLGGGGM